MLVLTRRVGEAILMDGGIKFTVLKQQGSQVSIGIDAPKSINIIREELQGRIRKEDNLKLVVHC